VETAQYFKLVYVLGLGGSKLARLVIGSSFEWIDMLMYTAGAGIVLMGEYFFTVVKPPAAVKK
jgi:hypothetical protein